MAFKHSSEVTSLHCYDTLLLENDWTILSSNSESLTPRALHSFTHLPLPFFFFWLNRTRQNREGCVSYLSFVFFHIQIFMSRQYSNRPYIPSRPRVSLQMCDFVSFSPSQTTDTTSDSSSWQLTDPLSCMHQPPTSSASSSSSIPPVPHLSTQNDFSYFQYPPHRHTLESPIITTNREINNNNNNQGIQHLNEPHPSCHVNYLEPNEEDSPRPLVPLNLVTVKKNLFFFG